MPYRLIGLILLFSILKVDAIRATETLTFACSLGASNRNSSLLLRDLTDLTAKTAGYDTKFVEYPWARVIATTLDGSITGSYCFSHSQEREKWVDFLALPFSVSGISFYKKASNPIKYQSMQQMLKLNIGVHTRSYSAAKLEELGASHLYYLTSDKAVCRVFWNDRIDLITSNTDEFGGLVCSHNKRVDQLKFVPIGPAFATESHKLGISKALPNYEIITEKLNNAFHQLISEGKAQLIYKKYKAQIPTEVLALEKQEQ